MVSRLHLITAALPFLLPLFARSMPAPWDAHAEAASNPSPLHLKRQMLLDGSVPAPTATASPATTLTAASTQTDAATATKTETETEYTTQTITRTALDNPAATDHSEAVLFLPPNFRPDVGLAPPSLPISSSIPSPVSTLAPDAPATGPSPVASSTPSTPVPPPVDPNLDANADADSATNGDGDGADASGTTTSTPSPSPTSGLTSTPTASSSTNSSSDSNAAGTSGRPLVMAYYPDWVGSSYPPEKIDFGRFDWIDFAFAVLDRDTNLSWDGSDDAPDLLRRLVARAHQSGKRVKLSVGGWTGSKYFSSAVSSAQSRETFAQNLLSLYTQFDLDGIDLDWEYPGQSGNSGNGVRPDDSANFLEFFRVLRDTLPPGAKITAATQTVPFAGPDGTAMRNMSDFAQVLDWVLIMNYDTWGSSSPPGPNAPLSDACGNSTQPSASALAALRAWTGAGFPASQLVLGVPSYGYVSRSSATRLRARHRDGRRSPVPDSIVAPLGPLIQEVVPALKVTSDGEDDGAGSDDGQIQFRELVQKGFLQPYSSSNSNSNSSSAEDADADAGAATSTSSVPAPAYTYTGGFEGDEPAYLRAEIENREPRNLFAGAGGFTRMWDDCSSTPYLRSEAARQVITYDDPVSLEMKAELVQQAGMLGVNLFDVHGDTDDWDLVDALRRGLGLQ